MQLNLITSLHQHRHSIYLCPRMFLSPTAARTSHPVQGHPVLFSKGISTREFVDCGKGVDCWMQKSMGQQTVSSGKSKMLPVLCRSVHCRPSLLRYYCLPGCLSGIQFISMYTLWHFVDCSLPICKPTNVLLIHSPCLVQIIIFIGMLFVVKSALGSEFIWGLGQDPTQYVLLLLFNRVKGRFGWGDEKGGE